jgi:hypothetical protein
MNYKIQDDRDSIIKYDEHIQQVNDQAIKKNLESNKLRQKLDPK